MWRVGVIRQSNFAMRNINFCSRFRPGCFCSFCYFSCRCFSCFYESSPCASPAVSCAVYAAILVRALLTLAPLLKVSDPRGQPLLGSNYSAAPPLVEDVPVPARSPGAGGGEKPLRRPLGRVCLGRSGGLRSPIASEKTAGFITVLAARYARYARYA